MPEISIIIPTYNKSSLVIETIYSLLKQSHKDFELLIVDDGSSDDTKVKVLEIKDERIKYFYKDNGGQASARNLGIKESKGSYIAFLDHDDIWPNDYLEIMYDKLKKQSECSMAYAKVIGLYKDGTMKPFFRERRYKTGWLTQSFFYQSPGIMPSAIVLKNKILDKLFFDEKLRNAEDYDFFLRLSKITPFLYVPNAHVIKRVLPDSQAKHVPPESLCIQAVVLERFYYYFEGHKYVSKVRARIKLSHKYRKAGKEAYCKGYKNMAKLLFSKAIKYWPFDIRLYYDMLNNCFVSSEKDPLPTWKFNELLPKEITVS
jgi:glycosyltransferase involved in cell wall biosynthesis